MPRTESRAKKCNFTRLKLWDEEWRNIMFGGGQRAGVTNRRKCCEWNTFHHCKFIECHGGASWANNSGGDWNVKIFASLTSSQQQVFSMLESCVAHDLCTDLRSTEKNQVCIGSASLLVEDKREKMVGGGLPVLFCRCFIWQKVCN